jgi:hypothetical protein
MAIDRDQVESMLADGSRSYREIARELSVSDWSIRKIARELSGDIRPMKRSSYEADFPTSEPAEISPAASWLILGGVLAVFALAVWGRLRWRLPYDFPNLDNTSTSEPNQFQGDNYNNHG